MAAKSNYQEFVEKLEGTLEYETMIFDDYYRSELMDTPVFKPIPNFGNIHERQQKLNNVRANLNNVFIPISELEMENKVFLPLPKLKKKINPLRALRIKNTCLTTDIQEALGKMSSTPILSSQSRTPSNLPTTCKTPSQSSMPSSETYTQSHQPKSYKTLKQSSISTYLICDQSGHSKSDIRPIHHKRHRISRQASIALYLKLMLNGRTLSRHPSISL